VRRAITTGVVGQNITPKDEVSRRRGLKLGLKSGFIGDQNAKKAKGTTQYLHVGSFRKANSLRGAKASHIQKMPVIKI